MISKSFKSDILNRDFTLSISTRGMRTIYKHGSLDNYILTTRFLSLTPEALKIKTLLKKAARKAEATVVAN